MARPSEWPVCEGRSLNHAVACNSDDCGIMRPSARGFVRLISVRAESKHGKRLNPRKADLHRWRETFAEKLRGWGIDAEASRLGVELFESGRSVAPAPATCRHPATSAPRPSTALERPAEATRLCHDPSRQTLSAAHAAGSRPTGASHRDGRTAWRRACRYRSIASILDGARTFALRADARTSRTEKDAAQRGPTA